MNDIKILRDLAARYMEVCSNPEQDVRRDLWRRHNSLKQTQPLIYVRAFAWGEMPESKCECADPFFRAFENFFRYNLFWDSLKDDSIFEPWVTVPAVYKSAGWGLQIDRKVSDVQRGSYKVDYPIKELDDISKMQVPRHEIDEQKTSENYGKLSDAIGDIITVNLDRGPAYRMWTADLSTDLGLLRGIEHFMMDMVINPEWLHRLVKFMADGVLKAQDEAEAAGDWGLCAHQNQAMPYAEELPDPAANVNGIGRNQLWGYMAAQEFVGVSPAMHEEFLLRYQLPILKKFGLVAYGCCEDLTRKIDMLRQIPNLRRIAVSPFADAAKCADQIGRDYVISYRPSPTDMVGYGFDLDRINSILRRDLEACKDCHVDITLKDVETVQGDPTRVRRWVEVTRQVIDDIWK
ncbi:MAG: uroporphyrinogen decarboxylase/cobalamine-independent methonine synthase family protein [Armatimonadota bacterium]